MFTVPRRALVLAAIAAGLGAPGSFAQVDEKPFSYQGCLKVSGSPATGASYDFKFQMFYSATGSAAEDVASEPSELLDVPVDATTGCFTVFLNDDGVFTEALLTGLPLWLDVAVRPDALASWSNLTPRQRVTPPPYTSTSGTVISPVQREVDPETLETRIERTGPARFRMLGSDSTRDVLTLELGGTGYLLHGTSSGAGRGGRFEITDLGNINDALELSTAGSGRALRATATSGAAIIAESDSGAGLLAQSNSGIGLRATSTSGTALDIVGTSAFTGTAAFNAAMPFTVSSNALISNLNAGLFDGQGSSFYRNAANLTGTLANGQLAGTYSQTLSFTNLGNSFAGSGASLTGVDAAMLGGQAGGFYRNASNLNAGTLPSAQLSGTYTGALTFSNASNSFAGSGAGLTGVDAATLSGQAGAFYRDASNLNAGTLPEARLSSNVALLALAQTFVGPKTFSALSTFNNRVEVSSSGVTPALRATNGGAGRAGEFEGALHTTGQLTVAYTAGTANRAAPIAYGSVTPGAPPTVVGTPNIGGINWNGARYLIDITGENYTSDAYITVVTPVVPGGQPPLVATSFANAGDLGVRIHTLQGVAVDNAFHFIVYKP